MPFGPQSPILVLLLTLVMGLVLALFSQIAGRFVAAVMFAPPNSMLSLAQWIIPETIVGVCLLGVWIAPGVDSSAKFVCVAAGLINLVLNPWIDQKTGGVRRKFTPNPPSGPRLPPVAPTSIPPEERQNPNYRDHA
ncbi:MAG: hypothetical protein ACKV2V_04055 [Blastocatellia bacterium]